MKRFDLPLLVLLACGSAFAAEPIRELKDYLGAGISRFKRRIAITLLGSRSRSSRREFRGDGGFAVFVFVRMGRG